MSPKRDKKQNNDDSSEITNPVPKGLDALMRELKGQKYPPVHLWNPDFCGDMDMRIARDGQWYYMGTPIGRPEMVRLFSSVLRYDSVGEGDEVDYHSGKYYLITPVEKLGIIVDDAPFLAISMEVKGEAENKVEDQVISFRTQTGDLVVASAAFPIMVEFDEKTQEPSPYVLVRDNLRALINRPLFYDLVNGAVEVERDGKTQLGVWSSGQFFIIGEI